MTDADNAPADRAIVQIVRSLDLALIEWRRDESYLPLADTPAWFTGKISWTAMPFLAHFANEARRYLHDHVGGVLTSEPFTVHSPDDELLVRARAVRIDERLIFVLERLEGSSDTRPILRRAREQALEQEALADNARAIHAPMAAVDRAVSAIAESGPTEAQRHLVDALVRAMTALKDAAAALPPSRKRR